MKNPAAALFITAVYKTLFLSFHATLFDFYFLKEK